MINPFGQTPQVTPHARTKPTEVSRPKRGWEMDSPAPSDEVSFMGGQAADPAPVQAAPVQTTEQTAPTGPPRLSEGLQKATQGAVTEILTNHGKNVVQEMANIAQSDQATIPLFQALGNGSNTQAQGSDPDFTFHMTQNTAQLDSALSGVAERKGAGNTQSFGQLMSEEMKVQAEAMALFPATTPEMMADINKEAQGLKPNGQMSRDRIDVELVKKRLPKETVDQAMATAQSLPLYQASEAAKNLTESNVPSLTAMADTANGFYPLALSSKMLFLQSAQGVGEHPSVEFEQMGKRLSEGMYAKDGPLDHISPKFGEFARGFVKNTGDAAEGFQGAVNLSMLVMAMNSGKQRAQFTGEDPAAATFDSLKTVIAQHSLMSEASPYLEQAAMNAVQNGQPAPPPPSQPALHLTQSNVPTTESQFNQHLVAMMSPEQVQRSYERAASHPLTAVAQSNNLTQLQDSFELPPMGETRVLRALNSFTNNLVAVEQAEQRSNQQ